MKSAKRCVPVGHSLLPLVALLSTPAPAAVEIIGHGQLVQPFSIVDNGKGGLFGVEYEEGNRVFEVTPDGQVRFLAGQGGKPGGKKLGDVAEGDGGTGDSARFNGMHELALAGDGKLYLADTFNQRVRVFDTESGKVGTAVGIGGESGFGGDGGRATEARLGNPYTVALDPGSKRLLIADLPNRRVREVDLGTGLIRTVAGNGKKGIPEDGSIATRAPLLAPRAACYARGGGFWIASREGHALRYVSPDGKIETVVNRAGKKGYGGDGGPAVDAKLNGPKHLALTPDGDVVIADDVNHCIRLFRVADRTIHLFAGKPGRSGDKVGDGPLDTELNRPHGARVDSEGNLWVADSMNHRLLKFPGAFPPKGDAPSTP